MTPRVRGGQLGANGADGGNAGAWRGRPLYAQKPADHKRPECSKAPGRFTQRNGRDGWCGVWYDGTRRRISSRPPPRDTISEAIANECVNNSDICLGIEKARGPLAGCVLKAFHSPPWSCPATRQGILESSNKSPQRNQNRARNTVFVRFWMKSATDFQTPLPCGRLNRSSQEDPRQRK